MTAFGGEGLTTYWCDVELKGNYIIAYRRALALIDRRPRDGSSVRFLAKDVLYLQSLADDIYPPYSSDCGECVGDLAQQLMCLNDWVDLSDEGIVVGYHGPRIVSISMDGTESHKVTHAALEEVTAYALSNGGHQEVGKDKGYHWFYELIGLMHNKMYMSSTYRE